MLMKERSASLMTIRNNYARAVEELSTAADNISNTLQKELFAGTADMHSKLSQQLWRDSSTAKAALSQLPIENKQLENTYKFLSQVGNYSLAMSEKIREGGRLSGEEYDKLSQLYKFSRQLCEDMWKLENDVAEMKSHEHRKTGFPNLGSIIGVLTNGLYILGGVPSVGKTTFMLQLADQMAMRGEHILYFTLEQSKLELLNELGLPIDAESFVDSAKSTAFHEMNIFSSI